MATLDNFVNTVLESVPNTPRFMVVKALRKVVRHFCKVSMCYQHTMTADFSEDSTAAIVPPEGAVFLSVFSAECDDKPVHHGVDYDVSVATKSLYWLGDDEPSKVKFTLCLIPSPDTDYVPDFLLELYGEAIAYGAAYEVALTNNAGLPQYVMSNLQRDYKDGIQRATEMALNNNRRVVPPKKHTFY